MTTTPDRQPEPADDPPQVDVEHQVEPQPADSPAEPAPARSRRPLLIAAAVAVAVILAGGGVYLLLRPSGVETLRADDPKGADACEALEMWINGKAIDVKTNKTYSKAAFSLIEGPLAADATTPAIKAAAGEDVLQGGALGLLRQYGYSGGSIRFADLGKLHAACVDAGVDMPEYREPAGS